MSFHPSDKTFTTKNKMFHPEGMFRFSRWDRWLIDCRHTAPYPLTQLNLQAIFEQCSGCQAKANVFPPKVDVVPIPPRCVGENDFQPWSPPSQASVWGMLFEYDGSDVTEQCSSSLCFRALRVEGGVYRGHPLPLFYNSKSLHKHGNVDVAFGLSISRNTFSQNGGRWWEKKEHQTLLLIYSLIYLIHIKIVSSEPSFTQNIICITPYTAEKHTTLVTNPKCNWIFNSRTRIGLKVCENDYWERRGQLCRVL